MILAYLLLLTGLLISAVAIYYSVVGLAAIFSAAVIPIIVMGSALEVAKLVCASWLKANWERAPRLMKVYMTTAVVVLMLITSMGIFGFLSKAHSDQSLVSGDVMSKISIYDQKIQTAKDNIDANRKALKQMDEAVDQVMGRSSDEKGADKAVAVRRSQQKERARLQSEIAAEQKAIASFNEEAAPIRAEVRKVEAEVGPLKYIAAFVYGATDESVLERAVTWVIITIIVVFDPLAVIMLLAAQMTFGWYRKGHDPLAVEEEALVHKTVEHTETHVMDPEPPVVWEGIDHTQLSSDFNEAENAPKYEQDDGPLTEEQVKQVEESVSGDLASAERFGLAKQEADDMVDKWNQMLLAAEEEARKEKEAAEEAAKWAAENPEAPEAEEATEWAQEQVPDVERPGDYVTAPEDEISKKKTTYMIKQQGEMVTREKK